MIRAVQLSRAGSLLASASDENTIRLWDSHVAESPRKGRFIIRGSLSRLGTILATISRDGIVEVRTVESNKLVWTLHDKPSDESSAAVVISPDDRFLALHGCLNTDIRIYDLRSGQLYATLE